MREQERLRMAQKYIEILFDSSSSDELLETLSDDLSDSGAK